jgi:hypothetical protein
MSVLAAAKNATHVRLATPTFKLVRRDAGSTSTPRCAFPAPIPR